MAKIRETGTLASAPGREAGSFQHVGEGDAQVAGPQAVPVVEANSAGELWARQELVGRQEVVPQRLDGARVKREVARSAELRDSLERLSDMQSNALPEHLLCKRVDSCADAAQTHHEQWDPDEGEDPGEGQTQTSDHQRQADGKENEASKHRDAFRVGSSLDTRCRLLRREGAGEHVEGDHPDDGENLGGLRIC